MPQVPWIRLYVSFFTHRKTMRMRRELGTIEPILRLWVWAAENAQDGCLFGVSDEDLEEAMGWRGKRGKAIGCARECGFIDGDILHGWEEKTGAGIESLTRTRKLTSDRQQRYRVKHGNALPNANETRPQCDGETRPDHQREDDRRGEDPDPDLHTHTPARDPGGMVAAEPGEPGKPTPYNLVSQFMAIRAEIVGGNKLFSQPQQGEIEKASQWLSTVNVDDVADIVPAIKLACKHAAARDDGWNHPAITKTGFLFGAFVKNWVDLREELHGCAPNPKKVDRSGRPERETERTPIRW
jgi:hypothetical protein